MINNLLVSLKNILLKDKSAKKAAIMKEASSGSINYDPWRYNGITIGRRWDINKIIYREKNL